MVLLGQLWGVPEQSPCWPMRCSCSALLGSLGVIQPPITSAAQVAPHTQALTLRSAELCTCDWWGGRCSCLYLCIEPWSCAGAFTREHLLLDGGFFMQQYPMLCCLWARIMRDKNLPSLFYLLSALKVVFMLFQLKPDRCPRTAMKSEEGVFHS